MNFDRLNQLCQRVEALLEDNNKDNWLMQQGWKGIVEYSQEEIHELQDAIDREDFSAVKDELADLLFHVCIYAKMAQLEQRFNLNDIARSAVEKLDRRYQNKGSNRASHAHWQRQKIKRKWQQSGSFVADMPSRLPSLVVAEKLQGLLESVGLDDPFLSAPAFHKSFSPLMTVIENIDEKSELFWGALVFVLVGSARGQGVQLEQALRQVNALCTAQLTAFEKTVHDNKGGADPLSLDAKLKARYWREATAHRESSNDESESK